MDFTFAVTVLVGRGATPPLLPLLVSSPTANASSTRYAEYTAGNGTSSLLFEYLVSALAGRAIGGSLAEEGNGRLARDDEK